MQPTPVALALLLSAAALTAQAAEPDSRIERGKYLTSITGCHDCHTPLTMGENGPVPDFSRALSGHPQPMALPPAPAAQGPWIWGGAARTRPSGVPGASVMPPTSRATGQRASAPGKPTIS